MATQFFSTAEIRKLESWPVEFDRDELVQYFTLTPEDVAWVNRSARCTPAKLGLAVQLCALPLLGFVPEDVPAAPRAAVSRLAVQLGIPVGALASYGTRAQTRTDHLKLAAKRLGWTTAELMAVLAGSGCGSSWWSVRWSTTCRACCSAWPPSGCPRTGCGWSGRVWSR